MGDTRIVVLDDDPTGTQSASDVTVLLQLDVDTLAEALMADASVYVQTNSRALREKDAVQLARRVREASEAAAVRLGTRVRFVLRGDSTLRGHVFAESEVFMGEDSVMIFVPAFPEGGRQTRDGIHYVRQGTAMMPVADTEFAKDPVFGFSTSSLSHFVASHTGSPAVTIALAEVRSGALTQALVDAPAGTIIVADAVETDDIAAIARSIEAAWERRDVVVRTAAPLAAELAGVASAGYLDPALLAGHGPALVVCGSHTDGAREQVRQLAALVGVPTEVNTARALADAVGEGKRTAAIEARESRNAGTLFIATHRDRSPTHSTLEHGAAVMTSLTEAAAHLASRGRIVITKGGITAADVITRSLGARHARVLGQLRPGVSVWNTAAADGRDILCVIVPGNMGDPQILAEVVQWTADDLPSS